MPDNAATALRDLRARFTEQHTVLRTLIDQNKDRLGHEAWMSLLEAWEDLDILIGELSQLVDQQTDG